MSHSDLHFFSTSSYASHASGDKLLAHRADFKGTALKRPLFVTYAGAQVLIIFCREETGPQLQKKYLRNVSLGKFHRLVRFTVWRLL
jgi:hypothetical protein